MTAEMQEVLDLNIAEIGLSVRTANFLEEIEVYTVLDLLNRTPDDLLQIANFGPKALEEVYRALEGVGFYRRPTPIANLGVAA